MSTTKTEMSREKRIFSEQPIWKSVLQMAIPSIIAMFVYGLYSFVDSIISIQMASDNYTYLSSPTTSAKDLVRIFMTSTVPITAFMLSITLLFGVGVARRVSVNIGAGNEERAIKTMKTTTQFSLLLSMILIPVLLFTAKPWIRSQFDNSPQIASMIADQAYKYVWIVIMGLPLVMFNQVIVSLLRSEARNKESVLAMLIPLVINLLLDYLFMGPLGMGIEGGAWATFISYIITFLMYVYAISRRVESRIKWNNLFGRRNFQLITLVGVILVGTAPFLRNVAQSITTTLEVNKIQDVSKHVYGNSLSMVTIMTSVIPILSLFFPIMFGFVQAGSPLAAYNFGAKNIKRVKETILWVIIFSFITGLLIYIISVFGMFNILSSWLGNENKVYDHKQIHALILNAKNHASPNAIKQFTEIDRWATQVSGTPNYNFTFHVVEKAKKAFGIMIVGLPLFSVVLGAMVLFGSTDRILLSIFSASLQGLILLPPFLYFFSWAAISSPGVLSENVIGNGGPFTSEYIFYWFYSAMIATTTIILTIAMLIVLKGIDKKTIVTIDTRVDNIHAWARARREARQLKRKTS